MSLLGSIVRWRSRARRRNTRSRRLCAEQLEPRLALTWAGVPPASITPPASPVAVVLNSQNDATGAASIATTEVDYYSFTAAVGGSYVISATTPSSSLDTVLGVFSATGQRLAYNDDISSSNRDSRLTIALTPGTKYFVGITNYTSSSRGSYTWTIDGPVAAPTDDAYENNDTLATAYNLGTPTTSTTVSGLVMADAADWFRFTTTAAGTSASTATISFQNSQGNLNLALYDAAGTLVGQSEGTTNSETISLSGLAAGTYYLQAYGNQSVPNPSYSLSINPPTAATIPPIDAFPDVAYFGGSNEWNLNAINAPESWAQGFTGEGVVVAVVDTGVDWDHPDLISQIWVNADEIAGNKIDDDHNGYVDDIRGWDFSGNDNNPDDANGHGTHVAGTIAALNNGFGATGVAPDAAIMPVRVLGSNGSGSSSGVAAGIRYAAQNGADIINLSLGGSFNSAIQSAIVFAQSLNVLVVSAAGNEYASTPTYPARLSASLTNIISVGAHNSSNTLASFSNDVGSSGAVQVDAPGVNIYSTYYNARYSTLSGTSMATPHVAGLAALALSANNALTANQLRTLIVNGANRVIIGSDSRGGINAAVTVALAAAGQTQTSAAGSGSTVSSLVGTVSTSWYTALTGTTDSESRRNVQIDSAMNSFGSSYATRPRLASAASPQLAATAVDHVIRTLRECDVVTHRSFEGAASAPALNDELVSHSIWESDAWGFSETSLNIA